MRRFFVSGAVSAVFAIFLSLSAGVASADILGQTQTFRVNTTYDALGATTASFTLRAAGAHGYFYVDDRYWGTLSSAEQNQFGTNLNALSAQFDSVIYPRVTSFYGEENTPGVDSDPHVVVLMERLISGNGGYFETIHNYPKSRAPASNAREMIYVSAESTSNTTGKTYVTHEFQHLTSFNQKELLQDVQDDVWLNEARSEYAITVSGFSNPFVGSTLQRRAQSFVSTPSDSLVQWANTTTDYAIASIFIHYLADQYGPAIVASTARTREAGVEALDEWLAQHDKSERFGDVFSDWMLASYLNDRDIDPRYGYVHDGLRQIHVSPVISDRLDDTNERSDYSASLEEWQPLWISNNISATGGAADMYVRMVGSADVRWRGAVVARYHEGSGRIIPFLSVSGRADVVVPQQLNDARISSVTVMIAQGTNQSVIDRSTVEKSVTITMSLSEIDDAVATPPPQSSQPLNGDLLRRAGQAEIYVVWGPYRRYLPDGVLKLYGFENRPVAQVSDEVFLRYKTSNYVREEGQEKVYALWPDGTKHWMRITAAQWDASARDWGAIFVVNGAELAWYETGPDITR